MKATNPASHTLEWLEALVEPPAAFRPCPLFVFNEEHEGAMGEPRITELLEGLRASGFGGVYLHPRPGLITEYLSPRWFELIRHAVAECRRLGLVPALYDENSYPSGFAGGHVPAEVPDGRSKYLLPVFGHGREALPKGALSVHAWDGTAPGEVRCPDAVGKADAWVAFVMRDLDNKPFLAEGSYVSLLDPLNTRTFLAKTHDRYRAELSDEDWSALGAIFTDEPHLPGSDLGAWSAGLHCTPRVLAAFQRRYGYDLRERLVDLYFDTPEAAATRFDFYECLHGMWREAWAEPLREWCDAHDIRLTGHYHDHDWPAPYATPGQMHLLASLDWPGTDFLECFELLGHDFYDPQGFEAAKPGQIPFGLFYLKQTESVAHQYGKERVMDESWGAGGHDATPADWLRIGRYLAVHGVNHFVPHHCMQTIVGTRKQDHPQFFSDQSPWFPYLKPMNDELARLSSLGAMGESANRVLLLDALTTGYTTARKADAVAGTSLVVEDCDDALEKTLRSLLPLRRQTAGLAQAMSDALVDFDIGDEYILEEIGEAGDTGMLRVGRAAYELLVWPGGMTNLRTATRDLLESYLKMGGQLIGIQPDVITVDGRRSTCLADWGATFDGRITWFDDEAALLTAMKEAVPPRIRFFHTPETGLAMRYRRMAEGGECYLLVNSHPQETLNAVPCFAACEGETVTVFHPGEASFAELLPDVPLRIPPTEARVLFRKVAGLPVKRKAGSEFPATRLRATLLDVEACEPNVLVVDRCALETGGRRHAPESVCRANQRYWTANGIPTNGWNMRVQLRGNLLKRDTDFSEGSGAVVRYRVPIAAGTPLGDIRLAVEKPELWTVRVNGQVVDFAGGERWRDPRLRAVGVGHFLREGDNAITLSAECFEVRQEIDAIYLIGGFAVAPAAEGFCLKGALPDLKPGSWRAQGMPFYDRAVDYRFRIDSGPGEFRLAADEWAGSLVELRHGDRREIAYGPSPSWQVDPEDGDEFTLRVVGSPKNLFGPWHVASQPRKRAWSSFWRWDGLTLDEPRPGADYDLLDLGLFV